MSNKEFEFGESYQEENQSMDAPILENYQDTNGMGQPGINPNNMNQPPYLDLNDPASFATGGNNQPTQPYIPQYNNQPRNKPNFDLKKNADLGSKISNLMEMADGITPDTDLSGNPVTGGGGGNPERYAIGVAIKAFHDAIKMLKSVEYWIPSGKEEYTNQLKKVSQPISKALEAYVGKIESLR